MSNRSAKFVPALFVSVLAGASLATVTDLRAQATQPAADNCLTAPKGATPAGGHWYYRIDRATKRKCWYLREENDQANDKSARPAPQDSPAATPAAAAELAPSPTTITRKAIADARAEWISQQARTEQNFPANVEPRATGANSAPVVQDGMRAIGANVLAPTPLATTRWSDTRGATPSNNPTNNPIDLRTAAADPPADQPQEAAEAPQQPAAHPVAPAATEPSMAKPTASLQMLFLVMAAALALAGITVSVVVRVGRGRARRIMRRKRLAMWDSAPIRRSPPSMSPDEEAPLRRARAAHNPRTHGNGNRERQVTDRLARLARSAQT